ncbi:MAG: hypothetical protein WAP74_03700 [Patescibacteria group bacterium]
MKIKEGLNWIVAILRKHKIPFQITGGLAARVYGSKRPINDIDIDIPEEYFDRILKDVKPYIIFGPAHYRDKRWDLQLLTLNYHGQEIDIGGAYQTKINDARTGKWRAMPSDLSRIVKHELFDITLPVTNPEDLVDYKRMLVGDHQKEDISAILKFLRKSE